MLIGKQTSVTRTTEADFKRDILKYVSTLKHVRLYNNVQAVGWVGKLLRHTGSQVMLGFARRITFGLFGAGGCDLIGWKTITITENMVGQRIARFIGVELKNPNGTGRSTPEQINIIELINEQHGQAAIINSMSEFREFIGEQ